MVHRESSSTPLATTPRKRRNVFHTVPRILCGTGATLPIDRVTQPFVQQDVKHLEDDYYGELRSNILQAYDWQPPGNTGNEYQVGEETELDDISDAFISLSHSAADKRCNSLLASLQSCVATIVNFLSKFGTVDEIRQACRGRLETKLQLNGIISK